MLHTALQLLKIWLFSLIDCTARELSLHPGYYTSYNTEISLLHHFSHLILGTISLPANIIHENILQHRGKKTQKQGTRLLSGCAIILRAGAHF